MTNQVAPIVRSGQSNAPQGSEQVHALIAFINDRPGSVDRVVGLLRRRRANMQTLFLGRSGQPNVVRLTVTVTDSEVGVDQLVEQIRKVVDVQHVTNLTSKQTVAREIALIKVNSTSTTVNDIVEVGQIFGAQPIDIAPSTVILEVIGSEEKVNNLIDRLQEYGIREVARSGCVAIARGTGDI